MGSLDKEKYYSVISERIKYVLTELNYSQADLVKICREQGFNLNQSAVSKIINSATGLSIMNVVCISKALKLDLNEILSTDANTTITLPQNEKLRNVNDSFITRADDNVFKPYLGEYNIYFYPTKSSENKLIHGKMSFMKSIDSSECEVKISFKTGKMNDKNEEIFKRYTGSACISLNMNAIYCSVMSKEIGEICYLIFSYIPILYEKLECRIGAVLTSSAGENRLPTMQRILISRRELTEEILYFLEGQLLLNASEILLSKNAFNAMLKDEEFPEAFKDYFCTSEDRDGLSNVLTVPYYYLYESMIRDSFMSQEDILKSICLLRKYSIAPKYNKVGGKADEIVYKLLNDVFKVNSNSEVKMNDDCSKQSELK